MTVQVVSAAHCLAALRARQIVKEGLKRQGLKPSHYSAREISEMARQHLAEHAQELMPEAIDRARAMILSGVLGKRAAKALRDLDTCAQATQAVEVTNEAR